MKKEEGRRERKLRVEGEKRSTRKQSSTTGKPRVVKSSSSKFVGRTRTFPHLEVGRTGVWTEEALEDGCEEEASGAGRKKVETTPFLRTLFRRIGLQRWCAVAQQ